jgi:hypothetical protein
VIPPFDPGGGGVLDVGEGLDRAGVDGPRRTNSVLRSPTTDSISASSNPSPTSRLRRDPLEGEVLGEVNRGVLHGLNRPLHHCLVERA